MARPVKQRRICELPSVEGFVPTTKKYDNVVMMTVDEYETVRLIDYMGLSQESCAEQMNVARTTVQAIYGEARRKIADMLVNGKSLKIGGGSYEVCKEAKKCCGKNCNRQNCKAQECRNRQLYCHKPV